MNKFVLPTLIAMLILLSCNNQENIDTNQRSNTEYNSDCSKMIDSLNFIINNKEDEIYALSIINESLDTALFENQKLIKSLTNDDKSIKDFAVYLKVFINRYNNRNDSIVDLIHPDIGLYELGNAGVNCFGSNNFSSTGPRFGDTILYNKNIVFGIPAFHFCDEGVTTKTGLYFSYIDKTQLATFTDETANAEYVYNAEIDLKGYNKNSELMRVYLIHDGFLSQTFYFIKHRSKWYFLCDDQCDCSA